MNTKQTIRSALALTAMALAANSAQAIDSRSWDRKITTASERFQLVLDGAAVLDKETQLVWERSPSKSLRTWDDHFAICTTKNVGGRQGWRMPTVDELHTLRDPSVAKGVKLPAGHPFLGISSSTANNAYWSTTTNESSQNGQMFLADFVSPGLGASVKSLSFFGWCVRGAGGRNF